MEDKSDDEDDDVPEAVWNVVGPLQKRRREEHARREREWAAKRWWRRPREDDWMFGSVELDSISAEVRAEFALAAPWCSRAEVTLRGDTRLLVEDAAHEAEVRHATIDELAPFREAADRAPGLDLWERDVGRGVREVELHAPDAAPQLAAAVDAYLEVLAAQGLDVRLSLSRTFVGAPGDPKADDEALVGRLVDQRLGALPWWRRVVADTEMAHLDPGVDRERALFCRSAARSVEAVVWTTGRQRGPGWWRAELPGWQQGWLALGLFDGGDVGGVWFVDDAEVAPFERFVV